MQSPIKGVTHEDNKMSRSKRKPTPITMHDHPSTMSNNTASFRPYEAPLEKTVVNIYEEKKEQIHRPTVKIDETPVHHNETLEKSQKPEYSQQNDKKVLQSSMKKSKIQREELSPIELKPLKKLEKTATVSYSIVK